MIKVIKYLILFVCVSSFAQKNYVFDYYSLYQMKDNDQQYVIGNSQDASYFLYIFGRNDSVSLMSLYDTSNDVQYEFKVKKKEFDKITSVSDFIDSYTIYSFNFSESEKYREDIFDVNHEVLNEQESIVTIKRYKNKRKKKLNYTVVYHLKDFPFAKNQFYTTDIRFGYKFDLNQIKTTGFISEQKVIYEKNPDKNFTKKLLDAGKLNFELELKTEPVITRTLTIIKYK